MLKKLEPYVSGSKTSGTVPQINMADENNAKINMIALLVLLLQLIIDDEIS